VIVQGRQFRYVGIGSSLRQRITQRLIRRDSSVTTGVSAVSLNLDLVSDVLWWEAGEFSDPIALEAAERIAFDALEPVLRSRGAVREAARALADDDAFRTRMHRLLTAEPSGRLAVPSLDSMVERVRRGASGASPRAARVSGSAGRRRPDHRLVGPPPAAMAASRLQPATTTPPPQPAMAARSVSPM
jgi:hypothetical protein